MMEYKFEPENDDGNKEYKLKLIHSDINTLEHISSQMRYRLEEGNGEALYTIGITDNGDIIGLSDEEYMKTKKILEDVCNMNNYALSLTSKQLIDKNKNIYEFLIREINNNKYIDIRVACAGNVDSGKSSLLGVLLTGKNDNGRGMARLNVFNFQHEIKSGRTSSVAQHILGFNHTGEPVHYLDNLGYRKMWPEIIKQSCKIITFFDLCGHEKYLKTTILGLTSQFPDLTFILVGGNMGITKITKEHIFLCLSLHIPFVIIITKIDICKNRKEVLNDTITDIKKLLTAPGIRKIPYDIKTIDDISVCVKNIHSLNTVPFFYVSNVTGEGIPILQNFLNLYTKHPVNTEQTVNKVELHVDQTFQVNGVGTVIGGQLVHGKIKVGDKLIVGPNNNIYNYIQVRSIHCKRVSVEEVDQGCYVCIGVKKPDFLTIHRGNVVLSIVDRAIHVREFQADVSVLRSHSTTIKIGYEPVVHTCSIRQTARILSITNKQCGRGQNGNNNILRTGDRATVTFQFCYKPEFIKKGFRILLAEGNVKIIGKITVVSEELLNVE